MKPTGNRFCFLSLLLACYSRQIIKCNKKLSMTNRATRLEFDSLPFRMRPVGVAENIAENIIKYSSALQVY